MPLIDYRWCICLWGNEEKNCKMMFCNKRIGWRYCCTAVQNFSISYIMHVGETHILFGACCYWPNFRNIRILRKMFKTVSLKNVRRKKCCQLKDKTLLDIQYMVLMSCTRVPSYNNSSLTWNKRISCICSLLLLLFL